MLLNQSGENGQNARTVLYDALILSYIQAISPLSHRGHTDLCRIKDTAPALGIIGGSGEMSYGHTISRIVSFLPI